MREGRCMTAGSRSVRSQAVYLFILLGLGRWQGSTLFIVKRRNEHSAGHSRGLGRSEIDSPGPERARAVPVVLAGSAAGKVHVLLGVLRSRVEAAHAACLPAREGLRTGPGSVRGMRSRYGCGGAAAALFAGAESGGIAHPLGL